MDTNWWLNSNKLNIYQSNLIKIVVEVQVDGSESLNNIISLKWVNRLVGILKKIFEDEGI